MIISKKFLATLFFTGIILVLVSEFIHDQYSCLIVGDYSSEDICRLIGNMLLISFPAFFFALVSFFMKNENAFESWRKFSFIFIPSSIILVLITPWYLGDGFMNIQKEVVALILSGVYAGTSLVLIAYRSFKFHYIQQKKSMDKLIKITKLLSLLSLLVFSLYILSMYIWGIRTSTIVTLDTPSFGGIASSSALHVDDNDDGDDVDLRPTREKVSGIHMISLTIKQRQVTIKY